MLNAGFLYKRDNGMQPMLDKTVQRNAQLNVNIVRIQTHVTNMNSNADRNHLKLDLTVPLMKFASQLDVNVSPLLLYCDPDFIMS